MAVITTGSFAKALWPGVNKWFDESKSQHKTEYTDFFEVRKSRRAWEELVGHSTVGLPVQRGEGSAVTYDSFQQGYISRFTHVDYALGVVITKNMVADDLYDVVGKARVRLLARSFKHLPEVLAGNVLNRAFNSSYTGADGQPLIDNDHPKISGGTWSNRPTTYADISEAALEQAVIDIGKYTDDRDMKMAARPQKLIVPVDLDFESNKILKTEYEVGTANNTVNLVRSRFPMGVKVCHWVDADSDAWFILTDAEDGLIHFERSPVSFASENDFDTSNARYKAEWRGSFGWANNRIIYGSQGA
jgi:phage major head subunit gpT-like protein